MGQFVSRIASTGSILVVSFAGAAALLSVSARAMAPPNDNRCIRAWNTIQDARWRTALATHTGERLLVLGAVSSQVAWNGKTVKHEPPAPVCVLTLREDGRMLTLSGRWRNDTVTAWTRQRYPAGTEPPPAFNARFLPDGRITKISRR